MEEQVVGQDAKIALLENMLQQKRVPHALLFTGLDGIGKRALAYAFARALVEGRSCLFEQHRQVSHRARHTIAGLFVVAPEGTGIKQEQVRLVIEETALSSPLPARVCLLMEADRLTKEAANSLLKTLEEPPGQFFFLLVSSQPHLLLPTIVSRCSRLHFLPATPTQVAEELQRRGYEPEQAAAAAQLSGGCLGQALTFLQEQEEELWAEDMRFLQLLPQAEEKWFWQMFPVDKRWSSNEVLAMIRRWQVILRDTACLAATEKSRLLYHAGHENQMEQLKTVWPSVILPAAVALLAETEQRLSTNTSPQLALERVLLELSLLTKGGMSSCRQ